MCILEGGRIESEEMMQVFDVVEYLVRMMIEKEGATAHYRVNFLMHHCSYPSQDLKQKFFENDCVHKFVVEQHACVDM